MNINIFLLQVLLTIFALFGFKRRQKGLNKKGASFGWPKLNRPCPKKRFFLSNICNLFKRDFSHLTRRRRKSFVFRVKAEF